MEIKTVQKIIKNIGLIRFNDINRDYEVYMHAEYEKHKENKVYVKVGISFDDLPVILTIAELSLEGENMTNEDIAENIVALNIINEDSLAEYLDIATRYDNRNDLRGIDEKSIEEMMNKLTEEFKDLRFDTEGGDY